MNQKFNPKDYIPQRVGLVYKQPTIVIEYLTPSSQKIYQHKIKLRKLTPNSNISDIIQYIRQRHKHYVANNKLTDFQLEMLIFKLKERLNTSSNIKVEVNLPPHKQLKSPINNFSNSYSSFASASNKLGGGNFEEIEDEADYQEDFEEESVEPSVDYDNYDLNKLTPEEVLKHKQKMDKKFNQNILRPGDPGYAYDKQANYKPSKVSEWDD